MTILHYDAPKHIQNAIYVPRLRSGKLVNPDPYRLDNLAEPIWHGGIKPSPFGNHTKGELMPAHDSPTPAIYKSAPFDPYDHDAEPVALAPARAASDLPLYKFPLNTNEATAPVIVRRVA